MNKTEQQFFALLRSGLWGKPIDTDLFTDTVDWEIILKTAQMQTVTGIVFDGISRLPKERQPSVSVMRKLYQTVIRIEQSHKLSNQCLTEIVSLLQSEGINPILLKGQGVAQNYLNPIYRQCGDIDLYIGKENYKKSCELAAKWDVISDDGTESNKHYQFSMNGVTIEFHRIAEQLYNPIFDKKFQNWTIYHLHGNKQRKWILKGTEILLPPVDFDSLYIFNHLFHHFVIGGIGLRQLCDWALYLHAFHDQINKDELLATLKSFDLLKPWQIFGDIIVSYLGLTKSEFPFYTQKFPTKSNKVLTKILQVGNFGFYNSNKSKRPEEFLRGKLHSLYIKQKWLSNILDIFPKEILAFYLWYWYNGLNNIRKGQ
ncbi:MAG: nucleotidyltransferase family protein [Dysgonomonas sp.]